jgi:hypothetical protein
LQSITENKIKEHYTYPQLPLAVYREIVAHLRQIIEVDAGVIIKPIKGSQESFDYSASQVEALWLEYPQDLATASQQQIKAILDYYGKRYQPWKKILGNRGIVASNS